MKPRWPKPRRTSSVTLPPSCANTLHRRGVPTTHRCRRRRKTRECRSSSAPVMAHPSLKVSSTLLGHVSFPPPYRGHLGPDPRQCDSFAPRLRLLQDPRGAGVDRPHLPNHLPTGAALRDLDAAVLFLFFLPGPGGPLKKRGEQRSEMVHSKVKTRVCVKKSQGFRCDRTP